MNSTNLTLLRKDLFKKIDNVIKYNEPLTINTKEGSAVIMSQDDYDALYETIYLLTKPEVNKKIEEGNKEDIKKMKTYNPKEAW